MDIIAELEHDIASKHLSRHPFYQLWNEGKVSLHALQEYAKQYYHFVCLFPRLISRVHSNTLDAGERKRMLENLSEEEEHMELWANFAEGIGVPREEMDTEPLPETWTFLKTMQRLASKGSLQGCAALLAYEGQISEIAKLKQEGLEKHYGVHDPAALEFFEEHGVVDIEHQKVWKEIIAAHATEENAPAVRTALNEALEAQWQLLDGIQREYCEA